jgi:hypothetical protein
MFRPVAGIGHARATQRAGSIITSLSAMHSRPSTSTSALKSSNFSKCVHGGRSLLSQARTSVPNETAARLRARNDLRQYDCGELDKKRWLKLARPEIVNPMIATPPDRSVNEFGRRFSFGRCIAIAHCASPFSNGLPFAGRCYSSRRLSCRINRGRQAAYLSVGKQASTNLVGSG